MKKEQEKITNQEKRFELSNEDNCLIYESYQCWWYTDYNRGIDWCLVDGLIDIDWLTYFVNRVVAGFEMDENEEEILFDLLLNFKLDDYLGNENKYPKDIRDFLKKYKFSIIPD